MGVTGLCPSSKVSSDDGPADDVPPTNQPNQQGNAPGPSAVVPVAPAPVEEAQEPVEEVAAPVEEVPVEEVHEPVDQDAAQPVEEHVPEDPVPRQPPVAPAQRVVREAQYFHALFPVGHPPLRVDYVQAAFEMVHPQGNPNYVAQYRVPINNSHDEDPPQEGDRH
ncbi:hypothetical protein CRE_24325 [Caenorhabditis remanei]|uniref:Uncharacterized protein n=1 Tax=Caenorhabditis remanei TaxID=31234 RepID=E3NQP7_CAERE|nr:hypothetical protein CRE_24325 [Caenorhabditis remanei]